MSNLNDGAFQAGAGIARKRGLPYSRTDAEMNQAALNGSGGNFYISAPRPARLFPTPMHEFRKGKYATTGGDRGFMTGKYKAAVAVVPRPVNLTSLASLFGRIKVFEYDVRSHTMMIDVDTSFVRFTSITQALGKNKGSIAP